MWGSKRDIWGNLPKGNQGDMKLQKKNHTRKLGKPNRSGFIYLPQY